MRWLIMLTVALAALAAATFAFARSSGSPGATAYALVDPGNGSPILIKQHTTGFTAVSVGPAGAGDYCLTAGPGVDVVDTAAVASEEAFYSGTLGGVVSVRYPTQGPTCGANQLEVKTFDPVSGTLSNVIAFTVSVP
jgi:hypothetical protein